MLSVAGAISACAERNFELKPPGMLPVLSPELQAPRDARPVSMARPIDAVTKRRLGWGSDTPGFPLVLHRLVLGDDGGPWVGNALANGLENAGYEVVAVKDLKSADTPYAITVEVTRVAFGTGIFNSRVVVGATVGLYKAGKQVFVRQYLGQYKGRMVTDIRDPEAVRSSQADFLNLALENFLEQAVPDLAAGMAQGSAVAIR